jgi:hypothetical protein
MSNSDFTSIASLLTKDSETVQQSSDFTSIAVWPDGSWINPFDDPAEFEEKANHSDDFFYLTVSLDAEPEEIDKLIHNHNLIPY